jgi:hypothetical protein
MSKFKDFINKAKKSIPDVANVVGKLATGNVGGAIAEVGEILQTKAEKDEKASELLYEFELKKVEFAIDEHELLYKDKADARAMYKEDSEIQKTFSITFLASYVVFTIIIMYGLYELGVRGVKLENYVVAIITSIYTGVSMKLNTIVEFLFGSSLNNKTKD